MRTANCANCNFIMISWNCWYYTERFHVKYIWRREFVYRKTKGMEENRECKRKQRIGKMELERERNNKWSNRERRKNKNIRKREEREKNMQFFCFICLINWGRTIKKNFCCIFMSQKTLPTWADRSQWTKFLYPSIISS